MRDTVITKKTFEHLDEWIITNPKTVRIIWELIKDIQRNPFKGKGKPEPLKYQYSGYWSRRITEEHRLIYKVTDNEINIVSCKGHYI